MPRSQISDQAAILCSQFQTLMSYMGELGVGFNWEKEVQIEELLETSSLAGCELCNLLLNQASSEELQHMRDYKKQSLGNAKCSPFHAKYSFGIPTRSYPRSSCYLDYTCQPPGHDIVYLQLTVIGTQGY